MDANVTLDKSPVEISPLRKRFGSNEVLKGIDLGVKAGEVIAIIGKSGSVIRRAAPCASTASTCCTTTRR